MATNLSLKLNPIFWIYTLSISLFIVIPAWFLFQRNKVVINNIVTTKSINTKVPGAGDIFEATHRISLAGKNGKITLRRRALSTQEYILLQKPEQKKLIDDETWMGVLLHGDAVQVLDQEGWSYKIRFQRSRDQKIITGYIAKSEEGGRPSLIAIK
jgi:hypothetical protein